LRTLVVCLAGKIISDMIYGVSSRMLYPNELNKLYLENSH